MATAVESEHGRFVLARVQAERSVRMVQLGAVLGAVLCIGLAAALQTPINQQRRDLQLVSHSDLYKDLPPVYGLVGAAGGPVRALTSIYLWMRAENLKQEGKYFQSQTLAKWICTLQPRFPSVWVNRAWDLSYNISVGTYTPRERWQWVYNGIRLLRDEGIPNNDRFAGLYQQLAWIWFHKVGDRLDDYHHFYKRQWAANMEVLLGAPPAGVSDEETINWFRPVAEAPKTLSELLAARPGVAELVSTLNRLGIDVNATTNNNRVYHPLEETFFRDYTRWATARSLAVLRSKPFEVSPGYEALYAFFDNAPREEFDALLAYLRAKVLREQYKMDPQYMLDLTSQLKTAKPIPIDWRTPFSQAIYWAMYGVQKATELKTAREFDIVNTDRVLLFSLSKLRESGRYVFRLNIDSPMESHLTISPDFRYLEAMHNMYLELGKRHAEENEDVTNRTSEVLKVGHINFLRDSVVELWLAGRKSDAQKWFDYLATTYKDDYTKQTQKDYLDGMEAFVINQIREKVDTYNGCLTTVYAMLSRSYDALVAGWPDEYSAQVAHALRIYNLYQGDKTQDPQGRRTLPPFVQIRAQALADYITDESRPVIYGVWAWQREQDEVKRECYDYLADVLRKRAADDDLDPAKAFPEPPGMEQWRREHPAPIKPEDLVRQEKERQKAQQK
ncbi:MAG TPA: hypothetical protein PKG54_09765 [Phycisphaerae bacterium]|jgi:hypothetical protein|nr:hypothetical protein [Phycisphaerae bacterium]HOJ54363.1 hypothetical protein [Phycisphaerae bacterium]HOL26834.1 hypothetical protein [Phycisphaerae bacterium]HPP19995.1 hypothetical protein [Phycisphaerae bacterium]HPU32953.1 hypothetical protein [Phycisphaerae bacterium]